MPTMESHLKISQLFPEMNKTEISLHLLRGSLISAWLLWTHHCQACAFYSPRPVYDRPRYFLLWCLCLHSTLLASNTSQRLLIGVTLQQTRDVDGNGNPSTPWIELHRILPNRQRPTNTMLLPRLEGKVFMYVIFSQNKPMIRMLLLKQVLRRV